MLGKLRDELAKVWRYIEEAAPSELSSGESGEDSRSGSSWHLFISLVFSVFFLLNNIQGEENNPYSSQSMSFDSEDDNIDHPSFYSSSLDHQRIHQDLFGELGRTPLLCSI